MLKKFFVLTLFLLVAACSSTPSKEQAKESIKKIIPVDFEIIELQESKEIPGLVEAVIQASNQTLVVYLDRKAKYLLTGSLMEVGSKTNLTMVKQQKYRQK